MSPRLLLHRTLAASLLCLTSVHAEEAAPSETAKAEPVAPYELKNRSKFTCASESERAPFWPIGWVKRQGTAAGSVKAAAGPKVVIDETSFKVTSILIGSGTTPSLAVVNGRTYSEGEFLRMPRGSAPSVRVRVQQISDGKVTLQAADQTLVASLQRPQLNAPRAEELLLDQDR